MIRYTAAKSISNEIERILNDTVPDMPGIPQISKHLCERLLLHRHFGHVSTLTRLEVAYPLITELHTKKKVLSLCHLHIFKAPRTMQCPICMHTIRKNHNAFSPNGCSHAFHGHCITEWFQRDLSCPVCRAYPEPIN